MITKRIRTLVLLTLVGGVAGCDNLADVDLLNIDADATLSGLVFKDLDGSLAMEETDMLVSGATVELRSETGGEVLHFAVTDANGQFVLPEVDVGSYLVGIDPAFVGDSLLIFGIGSSLSIRPQVDTVLQIGLTYPQLSIPEARSAAVGRRVVVEGIALNPLFFPGDEIVHISTGEGYLRTLGLGSASPNVGDSIRVVGTTAADRGYPVLAEAVLFGIEAGVRFPLPEAVTTDEADGARGGALDAALVEVEGAVITDTSSDSDSFYVTVDDGSGEVLVRLKDFLNFDTGTFTVGATLDFVRGLLVPRATGGGRWEITPRSATDDVQFVPN